MRPDISLSPVLPNGESSKYYSSVNWESLDEINGVFDDSGAIYNESDFVGTTSIVNPPGGWNANFEDLPDREEVSFTANLPNGATAEFTAFVFKINTSFFFEAQRENDVGALAPWNYTYDVTTEAIKFSWSIYAPSGWNANASVLQLTSSVFTTGALVEPFGNVTDLDDEQRLATVFSNALTTQIITLRFAIIQGNYVRIGVTSILEEDSVEALAYLIDNCLGDNCTVPFLFQFPSFTGNFSYDPSVDVLLIADDELGEGDGEGDGDGDGDGNRDAFGAGGIAGVVVGTCMFICVCVALGIVILLVLVCGVAISVSTAISTMKMRNLAKKHDIIDGDL